MARGNHSSARQATSNPWMGTKQGTIIRKIGNEQSCDLFPIAKTRVTRELVQQQRVILAKNNNTNQYIDTDRMPNGWIGGKRNRPLKKKKKRRRKKRGSGRRKLRSRTPGTNCGKRSTEKATIGRCYKGTSVSGKHHIISPADEAVLSTHNTRSKLITAKQRNLLAAYMIEKGIHIIAIQDHGIKAKSDEKNEVSQVKAGYGFLFIYSGMVGFMVAPSVIITNISKIISDRIIKIDIKTCNETGKGHMSTHSIISAYAPHSAYSPDVRQHFFDQLELETANCKGGVIVMGDMNAVIVKGRCGSLNHSGSIDNKSTELSSELLMNFLESTQLCSAATRRENGTQPTYYGTRGNGRTIDHINIRRKFLSAIKSVATSKGPLNSDHLVVTLIMKIKLAVNKLIRKGKPDYSVLLDEGQTDLRESVIEAIFRGPFNGYDDYSQTSNGVQRAIALLPPKQQFENDLNDDELEIFADSIAHPGNRKRNQRAVKAALQLRSMGRISDCVNNSMVPNPYLAWAAVKSLHSSSSKLPSLSMEAYRDNFKKERDDAAPPLDENTTPNLNIDPISFKDRHGNPARLKFKLGPPDILEWQAAVKGLANNKAKGPDGIPSEILKLVPELLPFLVECGVQAYQGNPPAFWLKSVTIPVFKKGDANDLKNYRPITLICNPLKAFNLILLNRLRTAMEPRLRSNQNGFRPNRSTTECMLCVQRVHEIAKAEGRSIICLFIDYSSAFTSVYWHKIEEALTELNVPKELIIAIMGTLRGASTSVRTPDGDTESFDISAGVLQGDTLAPYIFICIIDIILRLALKGKAGFKFEFRKGEERKSLTDLDYADDIIILVELANAGETECQEILQTLQIISAKFGLKINLAKGKTETMLIGAPSPTPFRNIKALDGTIVNHVSNYKYLGGNVCNLDQELRRRVSLARNVLVEYQPLFNSTLNIDRKIQIFNSLVMSIFLYSSETWTLTKRRLNFLKGAYTKILRFLHKIKVYSFATRVTNRSLFEKGHLPIEEMILRRRLNFIYKAYHSDQPIAYLLLAQPNPRPTGGQSLTYTNMITKDLGVKNAKEVELLLKRSEGQWSLLIEELCDKLREKLFKEPSTTNTIKKFSIRRGPKRLTIEKIEETRAKMNLEADKSGDLWVKSLSVGRMIRAQKELSRLVCRNSECSLHQCKTHCQFCTEAHHENHFDGDWILCDCCDRAEAKACWIENSDSDSPSEQWAVALRSEKYFCRDCEILVPDLGPNYKKKYDSLAARENKARKEREELEASEKVQIAPAPQGARGARAPDSPELAGQQRNQEDEDRYWQNY